VACRMVILSLKLQKVVDRANHAGRGATEPQCGASRQVFDGIPDLRSMSRHDFGSGYGPGVNEPGQLKVAGSEVGSDLSHMTLNLNYSGAVLHIAL